MCRSTSCDARLRLIRLTRSISKPFAAWATAYWLTDAVRIDPSRTAEPCLRPFRALARRFDAERALRPLAHHHHRTGRSAPIGDRLYLHGAALAARDETPVRGRDGRHRGSDRYL